MDDEQWTVTVDRTACLGSGSCAAISPAHFQLDGGKSRPINETIAPDNVVLDAANLCPAEAILVRDATGRPLSQ